MAKVCARDAYRSMVHDGILADGDCPDPNDLSILADTVYEKHGSQAALVNRLPLGKFHRARANSGYLVAGALLLENVISSILTLNYDLAIEDALTQLGAVDVQKIARPEDMTKFSAHNVIYLHRNVDEVDLEKWVLRASALESDWQQGWESMAAQVLLVSPVVTFAGLGSPAAVLLETTKRIRDRLGAMVTYQVDPSPAADNEFFQALALPADAFVQLGWNEFMSLLGKRVVVEQIDALRNACAAEAQIEGFAVTNVDLVVERLGENGLVDLGMRRAAWLFLDECYTPSSSLNVLLLSHLIIAASAIVQAIGAEDIVIRSEVVEFRATSGTSLGCAMLASGRGVRGWSAMEAEVAIRRASLPRYDPQPLFAIVAGATGLPLSEVVAPLNIVTEPRSPNDIVDRESAFVLINGHEVSRNPDMLLSVF